MTEKKMLEEISEKAVNMIYIFFVSGFFCIFIGILINPELTMSKKWVSFGLIFIVTAVIIGIFAPEKKKK